MEDVNYILFADQGLVTYRFVMDGDQVAARSSCAPRSRWTMRRNVAWMQADSK